jgi:SPP1 gp7 family putative phage head morphogenesis protein
MPDDQQQGLLSDDAKKKLAEAIAAGLYAQIANYWTELLVTVREGLETSMLSGVAQGALQLETADAKLLEQAKDEAAEFATARAAELVGLKYDEAGELVADPDAEWAISQTTEEKIRTLVSEAFEGAETLEQAKTEIHESLLLQMETGIFSQRRAELIGGTEVFRAQIAGHYSAWTKSGLVKRVLWRVTSDRPCPICEARDGQEFDLADIEDDLPPKHPNCACSIEITELSEDV